MAKQQPSARQKAINQFLSRIAKKEDGMSQANIGDIRQIARLIDEELDGMLYCMMEWKQSRIKGRVMSNPEE